MSVRWDPVPPLSFSPLPRSLFARFSTLPAPALPASALPASPLPASPLPQPDRPISIDLFWFPLKCYKTIATYLDTSINFFCEGQ